MPAPPVAELPEASISEPGFSDAPVLMAILPDSCKAAGCCAKPVDSKISPERSSTSELDDISTAPLSELDDEPLLIETRPPVEDEEAPPAIERKPPS
jgi:hypothetical protein